MDYSQALEIAQQDPDNYRANRLASTLGLREGVSIGEIIFRLGFPNLDGGNFSAYRDETILGLFQAITYFLGKVKNLRERSPWEEGILLASSQMRSTFLHEGKEIIVVINEERRPVYLGRPGHGLPRRYRVVVYRHPGGYAFHDELGGEIIAEFKRLCPEGFREIWRVYS
jgi:hypothetical protein